MLKKRESISEIAFIFLTAVSMGLYFYRIRWGMADVDESFYLSIPYRLIQGDALLVDEWNLSQLSAILLYPILNLYLKIFDSTEGIILAFRCIYVLFHTIVTVATYILLKKEYKVLAVGVSIMYFLFTPFNIMALSYNTMSLMTVWIITLIEISNFNQCKMILVLEGVFLAFAVLCNPYIVVLYLIYIMIALYNIIRKNERMYLLKVGYLTIGAGSVLFAFLLFVFSRASFEEMIQNIPMILSSPAHGAKGAYLFFEPIFSFARQFWWYVGGVFSLFLLGFLFKRVKKICFYTICALSAIATIFFAVNLTNGPGYAIIMIPLTLMGIVAYCYTENKQLKLFYGWCVGVIYALCMNMASNNGIYAISTGCVVSSVVSVLLIYHFLKEQFNVKEGIIVLGLVLSFQLFSEVYICTNHVFWENSPKELNSEIEVGPLKGIVTTLEKKAVYEENTLNLIAIKEKLEKEEKYIFLFKKFPSGYLVMNEMRMGAYSAWMSDIAEDLYDERINKYYEYHINKVPDIIYVDSESAMNWTDSQWKKYSLEEGYVLKKFTNGAYCLYR